MITYSKMPTASHHFHTGLSSAYFHRKQTIKLHSERLTSSNLMNFRVRSTSSKIVGAPLAELGIIRFYNLQIYLGQIALDKLYWLALYKNHSQKMVLVYGLLLLYCQLLLFICVSYISRLNPLNWNRRHKSTEVLKQRMRHASIGKTYLKFKLI